MELCNKNNFKKCSRCDTSDFAQKTDLANWKSYVDKLDIDKLKNVPSNLSNLKNETDKLNFGKLETTLVHLYQLSNTVKNGFVKKTDYDELVKKVNTIQTTDTSDLVQRNDSNTKINEIEKRDDNIVMTTNILLLNSRM